MWSASSQLALLLLLASAAAAALAAMQDSCRALHLSTRAARLQAMQVCPQRHLGLARLALQAVALGQGWQQGQRVRRLVKLLAGHAHRGGRLHQEHSMPCWLLNWR